MLAAMHVLVRFTRIRAYFPTLLSMLAVILLISPQNLFSSRTLLVFLANLFLTAFVYAFNDVEDAADDYSLLEKRIRNPVAYGGLTRTQGYLISFSLLLLGLFCLLLIRPFVVPFGLALALIGFCYSWQPVRFKSVPFIDLMSHILCLGVLQFFITYVTFRPFDLYALPFLLIIIPFSLMIDLFFELRDFDVDKKTKINNTIQRLGRFDLKKVVTPLAVIVIVGFNLLFIPLPSAYQIVLLLASMIMAGITLFKLNHLLDINPETKD